MLSKNFIHSASMWPAALNPGLERKITKKCGCSSKLLNARTCASWGELNMKSHEEVMKGHFGKYGGQFVPETLMHPLEELEAAYDAAVADPTFHAELDSLFRNYSVRP